MRAGPDHTYRLRARALNGGAAMVADTASASTLQTIIGIALLIFAAVMIWRWTASRRQQ